MENEQECCAHRRVIYKRIDNADGTSSDSWECSDCKHKFWPDVPSPTKPDTEEWEKEFEEKFQASSVPYPKAGGEVDMRLVDFRRTTRKTQLEQLKNIKDFIRQEKEKSYQEGRRSVFGEENYTDGLYKGLEDGRHSTYREIIEMIEQMKLVLRPNKEDFMASVAFQSLLSRLKERINNQAHGSKEHKCTVGCPNYQSGHSISVDGSCNMGCC